MTNLIQAVQAVLDRWDSPQWEWAKLGPTGDLMHDMRQAITIPATLPANSQDWAGMDGAIAFHLIERHSDGWDDAAKMMDEWRLANPAQALQPDTSNFDTALKLISASATVIGYLPENPGYNGSVLLIDEQEVKRVSNDLNKAMEMLESFRPAIAQPVWPAVLPVMEPIATVIEELEHDGEGWCSKIRWLYNPVPVGETLSWEQPK